MTGSPPGSVRPVRGQIPVVLGAGLALAAVLAVVHLGQGSGSESAAAIWRAALGDGSPAAEAVLTGSRVPRLAAAILVGAVLGVAGAAVQSVARNPLASPDTLAVNAGAYLAVVAVAATGVVLPAAASSGIAFAGGLVVAAAVLLLAGGAGPIRLVLAGSALALALTGISGVLLLLFSERVVGLFAWGNGSLLLTATGGLLQLAPIALAGVVGLLLLGRRLDLLGLGDDAAASVGTNPAVTRLAAVVLAVLLAAVAVTAAGPLGFVGLAAPAAVRLTARRVPGLLRHRVLLPASALAGVLVVVGSDVLLRAVFGGQAGAAVPTGVVTSVLGAVVLIAIAARSGGGAREDGGGFGRLRSRGTAIAVLVALAVLLLGAVVAAVLLGDTVLLTGDVANWLSGRANRIVAYVLETRLPRVAAALLGGAALAVAGALVQGVSRNPLADPGVLGVSGGAAVGAILVVTAVPTPPFALIAGAALAGAALAAGVVFAVAAPGGLERDRFVLVGIGVQAGATALVSLVIVLTDPFSAVKALTWLAGSTYGREADQVLPVAGALLIAAVVAVLAHRTLDVVGLDADTPRLLGLPLTRARAGLLALAVLLAATAVTAVGTVGFVGLVAPHAARALVGARSARSLPATALLGALLVVAADTVGRTVIAPAQLPVGLVTAVLGAPYFLVLLRRAARTSA